MEIERLISWFDKNTEELAGEMDVTFLHLEELKKIFNPPKEDPLMYNPYDIKEGMRDKILKMVDINLEFDKYTYQLDCFQKG